MGTGCRLWGLRPSGLRKDSSEGAEETDVGRRFYSETVQGGEGMKEDRVFGLFLQYRHCVPLVLGSEWQKKLAGLMSTWLLLIL